MEMIIKGPDGQVHYTRPPGHPDVEEARRTPGYKVESSLKLIPVRPLNDEETPVLVAARSGSIKCISGYKYPLSKNGSTLRVMMTVMDMLPMNVSTIIGLSPLSIIGLEQGSYNLSDSDWLDVFSAISQAWLEQNSDTMAIRYYHPIS